MNTVSKAIEIYHSHGYSGLFSRVKEKITVHPLALPGVDHVCYMLSRQRLQARMVEEEALDDLFGTVEYTEVTNTDDGRHEQTQETEAGYTGITRSYGEYSGLGRYSRILLQQQRAGFEELFEVVKSREPDRMMEIGTDKGGSLYFWCRGVESTKQIISLDISYHNREKFLREFAPEDVLAFVEGSSHEERTYQRVEQLLDGETLDFLYIDGDHSYEGVKHDFEAYRSLVSKGGIIGLHDIKHRETGVPEFWTELKQRYETEEFGKGPTQNGLVYL